MMGDNIFGNRHAQTSAANSLALNLKILQMHTHAKPPA